MTVYEALSFAVAFATLVLLLNSQNNKKITTCKLLAKLVVIL